MNYHRLYLLTWTIIPAIALLASANYLLGAIRKPSWDNAASFQNPNVLSDETENALEPPPIDKIDLSTISKTGAVSIIFDDAWISQYNEGYPLMERYGFKGGLAVVTQMVGYPAYMDWIQIKSMQYHGWETIAHTRNHICDIKKYDQAFIFEEILGSKQDLLAQGLRADDYISPCGIENKEIVDLVKTLFFSLRSSESGINRFPLQNPYALKSVVTKNTMAISDIQKWISDTKQQRGWLILTFHQIEKDPQGEYAVTPEYFENILKAVKESNLPVVLPVQLMSLRK